MLSLNLLLFSWPEDQWLFVSHWQFPSGTAERCCMREVLPSHMKPHLFGGRTEIPAQVSRIRGCTPRDGSRALPLGALASLLNVSARLLVWGSPAGGFCWSQLWVALCICVPWWWSGQARGSLVYVILPLLCWGSVQLFGRNWGFDVRFCVCVLCFCFNICMALPLCKKRAWPEKWDRKQMFAVDL